MADSSGRHTRSTHPLHAPDDAARDSAARDSHKRDGAVDPYSVSARRAQALRTIHAAQAHAAHARALADTREHLDNSVHSSQRQPQFDTARRATALAQRPTTSRGVASAPGERVQLAGPPLRYRLKRFVARHGWRAYALPILVVLTVVAVISMTDAATPSTGAVGPAHHNPTATGAPQAAPQSQLKSDGSAGSSSQVQASDALPDGAPYTVTGTGTFTVIPGTSPVVGTGGRLYKYTIAEEGGVTGVDMNDFATFAVTTLSDSRSWIHAGNVSLERVADPAQADFQISLTSSMTIRTLCGYTIPVETSCYAASVKRVLINVARWVRGDLAYIGDLTAYHQELVNHEVGHALGHIHSHQCLADGLAPAMMQQTLGLKSITGQICQANPWPYPVGATDAPGIEDPDTPQNIPIQGAEE